MNKWENGKSNFQPSLLFPNKKVIIIYESWEANTRDRERMKNKEKGKRQRQTVVDKFWQEKLARNYGYASHSFRK
jgi:hypothetical protein